MLLLIASLGLSALFCSTHGSVIPVNDLPGRKVQVQGHRGGSGLRPEETLWAFAYGMEVGVDVLEMDMVFTKDEIPVLWYVFSYPLSPASHCSLTQARRLHRRKQMPRHDRQFCGQIHREHHPRGAEDPRLWITAVGRHVATRT